jgi:hypothetical protein
MESTIIEFIGVVNYLENAISFLDNLLISFPAVQNFQGFFTVWNIMRRSKIKLKIYFLRLMDSHTHQV